VGGGTKSRSPTAPRHVKYFTDATGAWSRVSGEKCTRHSGSQHTSVICWPRAAPSFKWNVEKSSQWPSFIVNKTSSPEAVVDWTSWHKSIDRMK